MRFKVGLAFLLIGFSAQAKDPLMQAKRSLESGLAASRIVELIEVENLVNTDTVAVAPGGEPYRGQIVYVTQKTDPKTGATMLETKVKKDHKTPYEMEYHPAHPGAHAETGILLKPNVKREIIMANLNENAIQASALARAVENIKFMDHQILDLLKGT